jgi:transcriptional regulator with XRE-family HTH domain
MKTFAERLKYAMDAANMKQMDLAEKSGATRSAVSQYLAGKNIPSRKRMADLAEATGVTVEFLSGEAEALPAEAPAPVPVKRISPATAARCLGKSDQFVRVGLQRGILPFGTAVPGSGGRWSYYINPAKFRAFVGDEQFNAFFSAGEKANIA